MESGTLIEGRSLSEVLTGLDYATESLKKHPRKAALHVTKGEFLLESSAVEQSGTGTTSVKSK